jgi:hypothetical protein
MPELQEQREYIINELNLSALTPEEQDVVLEGLGELAMKRVLVYVIEALADDKRDELEQLILAEKDEELQTFIGTHVPNAPELIQRGIMDTIEEHKRLMQEEAAGAQ